MGLAAGVHMAIVYFVGNQGSVRLIFFVDAVACEGMCVFRNDTRYYGMSFYSRALFVGLHTL